MVLASKTANRSELVGLLEENVWHYIIVKQQQHDIIPAGYKLLSYSYLSSSLSTLGSKMMWLL